VAVDDGEGTSGSQHPVVAPAVPLDPVEPPAVPSEPPDPVPGRAAAKPTGPGAPDSGG
jgi:hypothetical protein